MTEGTVPRFKIYFILQNGKTINSVVTFLCLPVIPIINLWSDKRCFAIIKRCFIFYFIQITSKPVCSQFDAWLFHLYSLGKIDQLVAEIFLQILLVDVCMLSCIRIDNGG